MEGVKDSTAYIDKLCKIWAHKLNQISFNIKKENPSQVDVETNLKTRFLEILSNNELCRRKESYNLPQHWIEEEQFSVKSAVYALAGRMRMKQRRFEDADRIEEIINQFLKDDLNIKIVSLLLYLAKMTPKQQHQKKYFRGTPTFEQLKKSSVRESHIQQYDYSYNIPTKHYKIFPLSAFEKTDDRPLMLPPAPLGPGNFDPHVATTYQCQKICDANGALSWFGDDVFTNGTSSNLNQCTLFGALRYNPTHSLDIKLSFPNLYNQIDIVQNLLKKPTLSDDDGFFSRSSSCASSPEKPTPVEHDHLKTWGKPLFEDNEPYEGYRKADFNMGIWKLDSSYKPNKYKTWETLGQPLGLQRKLFLTEAGNEALDALSFHRRLVVHNFSKFFNSERLPSEPDRVYVREALLREHSLYVALGVHSESFTFNKIGKMFLPKKNLYFSGVDPLSLMRLLLKFAELGTCYYRLCEVSTPTKVSSQFPDTRGAIYMAFRTSLRRYLNTYHMQIHQIKEYCNDNSFSILNLTDMVQNSASQLRYLCSFCGCGTPDSPQTKNVEIPVGVKLLTHLYDEAIACHDKSLYLVLITFLADSCKPYLQYLKAWMFYGQCVSSDNDFMLFKNNSISSRRSREWWLKHVSLLNPNNPASCVPSFLKPFADDVFVCGKTIALMLLIDPQHFLVTEGMSAPDFCITFEQDKLADQDEYWKMHEKKMYLCEAKSSMAWVEYKRLQQKLKMEKIQTLRVQAEKKMENEKELLLEELRKADDIKRKEFTRLALQASEAEKRKKMVVKKEKENDVRFMQSAASLLSSFVTNDEKLLEEAKQEIIDRYEEMNRDVETRTARAAWSKRRQCLDDLRLKFFAEDKLSESKQQKEIKQKETTSAATVHLNEIDFIANKDSKRNPSDESNAIDISITGRRKHVKNCDIANSSISFDEAGDTEQHHSTRTVTGVGITDSTVFNEDKPVVLHTKNSNITKCSLSFNESPGKNLHYISNRQVPGRHVSDSTQISSKEIGGSVIRPSSRSVAGKNVSDSQMNKIFSPTDIPSNHRKESQGTISSIQDLIYPQTPSLIGDKPKSKWEPDKDIVQKLQSNSLQQHASDSTIEELMYHQQNAYKNAETRKIVNFMPKRNPVSSRASSSTIQTLIYPTEKPSRNTLEEVTVIGNEDFELQIPQSDFLPMQISSWKKIFKETRPFQPVDLWGQIDGEYQEATQEQSESVSNYEMVELRPLTLLIRQCLMQPIKSQVLLANRCIVNHFMVELNLLTHFDMIRHFMFFEDGEFAQSFCNQLFEKIHSGSRLPTDILHPVSMDYILSQALQGCTHANSPFIDNLSVDLKFLPSLFKDSDPNALGCISLHYNIGWPCNIIITEEHMSMYNKVFSFFIQLKHVVFALHDINKRLSSLELNYAKHDISACELRQLHLYRHEMQHFAKVMQGYMATKVLHLCWEEFLQSLETVTNIDDIYNAHNKYINKCIIRCLLSNKAHRVMNVINDIMKTILVFRSNLASGNLSFNKLNTICLNYTKYSQFLFSVVTNLVAREYQPYLEDFLTRLNFNGFYNRTLD